MKAVDFNNLTELDFRNMSKDELRALVSDQGARANVRYQNIKSRKDTSKEATAKVERSGGRFSTKGRATHKALVREAKRIQEFNKNPTGTVRGAKQAAEQIEATTLGKSVKDIVKQETKEMKKAAEKQKGKKLSKKDRKALERGGREKEKELREKVKEEWNKYVEDGISSEFEEYAEHDLDLDIGDIGEQGEDLNEINKTQSTTEKIMGQESYKKSKEDSPFTNVNDRTAQFDVINKELGADIFI